MLQVYIETLLQGYIHDVPSEILTSILQRHLYSASWLVGCFGFKGPLRQYFSLHRAVSQREGERRERVDESKNVQTPPPAPTASAIGPCPTVIKITGRPGTGSLLSTIAPSDRPLLS